MGRSKGQGFGRRIWFITLAVLAILADAVKTEAQAPTGLAATRIATGFDRPLYVTAPPGDYNRLFVVCQSGKVHIVNLSNNTVNATPFLDIGPRLTPSTGEQGLLGLAFDPNYATNGKFYLYFTVSGGFWGNGTTRVSQFSVSANPNVADISLPNEKLLVTFDHPQTNHNAGWIGFSPRAGDDNNLYIATGDGGNGNDQGDGHIEPGGNAQNKTTLLGKMLRIHVDAATGTASIPANNPFANPSPSPSPTPRPEIFLYGLRNPYRNSFDRANGRMFLGDVGQDTREEVDVQQATNPGGGENYGWRLREGTIATPSGNPVVGGNPPPGNVEPIIDYPRSTGATVLGGYVYRGRQIPQLRGIYVFGDYAFSKIFTLNYNGTAASNFQTITGQLFPIPDPPNPNITLGNPSSFGEDANGELYITDITKGSVYKIVPTTPNVQIDSVTRATPNGHAFVHGYGVPFKVHTVKAAANITDAFMTISTVTAAGDGSFQFEDINAGSFPTRYYRVTYP